MARSKAKKQDRRVRLSLRLEEDVWRRLRYVAADRRESAQSILEGLVREFLLKQGR